MKKRVKSEDGIELSTICRQLKMKASDGKMRVTEVADAQALLRIIQSIPSPKANHSNNGLQNSCNFAYTPVLYFGSILILLPIYCFFNTFVL
jgi:hypothetical protein